MHTCPHVVPVWVHWRQLLVCRRLHNVHPSGQLQLHAQATVRGSRRENVLAPSKLAARMPAATLTSSQLTHHGRLGSIVLQRTPCHLPSNARRRLR